jgi:isocitrate dehydrogenase (NAD+)
MSDQSVTIGLIRGDGIGPEITQATLTVLDAAGARLEFEELLAGQAATDAVGHPMPQQTIERARELGVILKGPMTTPVGGGHRSPNVTLRREMDLYANVRPVLALPGLRCVAPEADMVIVRENTEGLYAGIERETEEGAEAIARVTRQGSARVARFAFEYARQNGRDKVTILHKANILKISSGLFLRIAREVGAEYPDIECDDLIIDAACMKMVMYPEMFDVVVTTNLFGDIISDLAAGLVGGLGLAPGANIGADGKAMFEAVHGTAPDIAGKGIANPTALLMAACQLLTHVGQDAVARRVHAAVLAALHNKRTRTGDLGGKLTTAEFTGAVIAHIAE